MKKLINTLYSLWCYIAFFLFVPMAIVAHALIRIPWAKERTRLRVALSYHTFWLWCWQQLTGIKFSSTNRQFHNPDTAWVLVCNHCNLLDMLMMGYYMRDNFKVLVKQELWETPVMAFLFHSLCIPVDRSSKESRQRSMDGMKAAMEAGFSVLIFPEGTRNPTQAPLKEFFDGAFVLAIEAQAQLLPMVITHSRDLQPVSSWRFYPGRPRLTYLPPISAAGLGKDDLPVLKAQVYSEMESAILSLDPKFQDWKP